MDKKIISFTMVWFIAIAGVLSAQDINWEDISRGNYDARALLINPEDNRVIFAGVTGGLLKSEDSGKSWRRVLVIRGKPNNINEIVFAPPDLKVICAATDNGLYRSQDGGGRWERIFRGKNNMENQCTAVLCIPGAILVGTKSGLFKSKDGGHSWNKDKGEFNNLTVFNIDASCKQDKLIYLSAACGIFKSLDGGDAWEKVYVSYSHSDDSNVDIGAEEANEDAGPSRVNFVRAGIKNADCVYLSGTRGVYKSTDQGKTWNKLAEYGLLNRDVKMFCLLADQMILGLTQTGVFLYQNERWLELSFDLSAGKLSYLILDNKGNIYIAGEKGVFKAAPTGSSRVLGRILLQEYLKDEPEIRCVQQAAIKYAEVGPEKISQWRKSAAKKALLPQVSIGLDRNSSDLWHWETGSTTKNDDDTLRHGQDSIDWDVALSWDLSDLIWNEAQTSIDVRSKLMVELRDDILDEVNKLYFERLRVKSELDNLPIEDRNKRFDKELKLEELTASLDSLTAGYYSEQSRMIMSKK